MSVLFSLIEWEKLHFKSEKRLLLTLMGRGGVMEKLSNLWFEWLRINGKYHSN